MKVLLKSHFINGEWKKGAGPSFSSKDPASGETVWTGCAATKEECEEAIATAKKAFSSWSQLSFEKRAQYLKTFADLLSKHHESFSEAISQETGKPLWESKHETTSMIQKVAISIDAYQERCKIRKISQEHATLLTAAKPHGAILVLGPFNFPGLLPTGHIVPALLAGNTVIFKGSEKTPLVNEKMASIWEKAHLPKGVFNCVQGAAQTAKFLSQNPLIDGIFFTGSYETGSQLMKSHCVSGKILALEMGGNNPLVIHDFKDAAAAAFIVIQSAFLTSGQRCSGARRLILVEGPHSRELIPILMKMMEHLKIGSYKDKPEPYMGPVISLQSRDHLLKKQKELADLGGKILVEMKPLQKENPFLTPGLMDVTDISNRKDEEIFGPFLQLIRVRSFKAAIEEANKTEFGLTASLLSRDEEKFRTFFHEIQAGVINWNHPTTGASALAPFGGLNKSGNHRPSGYWAADYCSTPTATTESSDIHLPKVMPPGIAVVA